MQIKKHLLVISQNYKIILQAILGLLFVGFGIYFIKKEKVELGNVKESLLMANPAWIIWGLVLLGLFILVQGLMYQQSFRAIQERIKLSTGVGLFLKRNLVSVFLPAGALTNMLFFNRTVEQKEGVSRTQVYFASTIFSFCSILSAVIIGIPSLLWLLLKGSLSGAMTWGILAISVLLIVIVYLVYDIFKQGRFFRFLENKLPSLTETLETLFNQSFNKTRILLVLGLSVIIELIGIAHLFISVKALGGTPSVEMAFVGYAIVLLLLMSSPFLRGIGAVEAALTYALVLFGLSNVMALSVAFLFRFFEFWAVLVAGLAAIISHKNNLFLRVFPAFLLFILGFVNIFSGITPAMPSRLMVLKEIIPLDAIHATVWLTVLSGVVMLALSIFLVRGLRNAWILALILSGFSFMAHLAKGIDWEEAIFAFVTFTSLVYERKQYFIQTDLRFARRSFVPLLAVFAGIIILGTISIFLLDINHFNTNLSLLKSFQVTLSSFFLLSIEQIPVTKLAREILYGINLSGGISIAFFVFLLLRPLIQRNPSTVEDDLHKAMALVEKYGKSGLDYFKTYSDKKFWFSEDGEGFVSFKTSRNYAIALENPVCADKEAMLKIIPAFDSYCYKNGLRPAYYRVPESYKTIYEKLGKKLIPIGEEAVANLETWTLSGGEKSAMRNAINKVTKLGFTFHVNQPPQKDAFLQQLKATSEEWLKHDERTELVFSQGLFNEKELKNQVILTTENPEGKIVGFINLIPDYNAGEANFDLMRKTEDAPNGTMDFLFAKMFEYLKSIGFKTCCLGMVPMSGIHEPENIQERVIKLAYEKIKQFGHYKSLRGYKEKFNPDWQMMYMVYSATFDLIYLPGSLEQVVEP